MAREAGTFFAVGATARTLRVTPGRADKFVNTLALYEASSYSPDLLGWKLSLFL